MIRKLILGALSAVLLVAGPAIAQEKAKPVVENIDFSFDGIFGTYDQMQLQRGLQVFTQSCAACHGLKYVPLRTLSDLGYTPTEVRAYAAQYDIYDAEKDEFRPRIPTDPFPESAEENAPDLSLMAKARAGFKGPYGLGINQFFKGMGGPEYIAALLKGYSGEEKEEAGAVIYENGIFYGGFIAMSPPLFGEDVDFADGSPNDLASEAEDVAAFLMWAAEPKLAVRKQVGFIAVIFLGLLSVLLYLTNKRIWAPVKGKNKA